MNTINNNNTSKAKELDDMNEKLESSIAYMAEQILSCLSSDLDYHDPVNLDLIQVYCDDIKDIAEEMKQNVKKIMELQNT